MEAGASSRPPSLLETSDGDEALGDDEGLAKGTSIGRYLVLGRLGAGAMGVVYAAYDPELDRKIAIKLLRPEEGKGDRARRQERLVREAKAIAKLSHPNVVGIFDVGVHDGQVFLAMEYLGGGTLREWVAAKKRPWREIVTMFIDVGHGLAAAHAEGLIHRDFKPDNVLLDKQGKPKVVDFGLVRLMGAALETSATGSVVESTEMVVPESVADTAVTALTRTGAMTGTPAYMAPEQFLGKPIDARTDQFAFCVALYEALYGERPFAGETVMVLAGAVTSGRTRPSSHDSIVPPWLRRVVLAGLDVSPAARFASMSHLVGALAVDPSRRRRKVLAYVVAAIVVLGAGIAVQQRVDRRQREMDRRVATNLDAAANQLRQARAQTATFTDKRRRALALFDSGDRRRAEELWKETLDSWSEIERGVTAAMASFDVAHSLRPSSTVSQKLIAALLEHIKRSEAADRFDAANSALSRLQLAVPPGDVGHYLQDAGVSLAVSAYPTEVEILRYDALPNGALRTEFVDRWTLTSPGKRTLARGSYLFRLSSPARRTVDYPILLRTGEQVALSIVLPGVTQFSDDVSYVPAGRFLVGESDEKLRTGFTNSVPLHETTTQGFLISKREITYRDWIRFLDEISRVEAPRMAPHASESVIQALVGSVQLNPLEKGRWELALTPVATTFKGRQGEPIIYPARAKRRQQDWLNLPVSGVSAEQIDAYAAWLDTTARLPGARLCHENEWERGARGADDRRYPHGNALAADDANHDVTYGRIPGAYGPDEVGSHPNSRSPFGLDDTAGNVWELVASNGDARELLLRGGGYYHFENSQLLTNREPFQRNARSAHIGARLCADLPASIAQSTVAVSQSPGGSL